MHIAGIVRTDATCSVGSTDALARKPALSLPRRSRRGQRDFHTWGRRPSACVRIRNRQIEPRSHLDRHRDDRRPRMDRPHPRRRGPMKYRRLHPWNLSPKEAVSLQRRLAAHLVHRWDGRDVTTVAGIDVSVRGGRSRAAVVLLSFPGLEWIESTTAEAPTSFPYVPSLLTFREAPVVLDAWSKLSHTPDLVLFDGQGIAHPRRIGLAAHLGLWLDLPTIGCAKSRLYGHHAEPGSTKGDRTPLLDEHEPDSAIGSVLRTRTNVKPLFISPGHRIDVDRATGFVLRCCTRYRLPEPTRWAHRVAGGHRHTA